jgi:hypothetical protein
LHALLTESIFPLNWNNTILYCKPASMCKHHLYIVRTSLSGLQRPPVKCLCAERKSSTKGKKIRQHWPENPLFERADNLPYSGPRIRRQRAENPPKMCTISSFADLAEIALGLELLGHVVVEHVHVVGDGPEAGTRLTLHRTVRKKIK